MTQTVTIPTPFRKLTNDQDAIMVEGENLTQIIDQLEAQYPGFRDKLCEANGKLRRFINIYIDGEDIRFLEDLSTPVPTEAEVSIVLAVAGG